MPQRRIALKNTRLEFFDIKCVIIQSAYFAKFVHRCSTMPRGMSLSDLVISALGPSALVLISLDQKNSFLSAQCCIYALIIAKYADFC